MNLASDASPGVRQKRKCISDSLSEWFGSGHEEVFKKHLCGASTVKKWGVLMSSRNWRCLEVRVGQQQQGMCVLRKWGPGHRGGQGLKQG